MPAAKKGEIRRVVGVGEGGDGIPDELAAVREAADRQEQVPRRQMVQGVVLLSIDPKLVLLFLVVVVLFGFLWWFLIVCGVGCATLRVLIW